MADVNALYDSIVTAGRDLHAMPLATEGNPLSFVVGMLITCALVAFGIRKVCRIPRHSRCSLVFRVLTGTAYIRCARLQTP